MMILRSSPASPFGRKVRIAAALLGLTEEIEILVADTNDARDSLRLQNPLGKIPVLILEDQTPIFDSRVILEYLDQRAGGDKLIPAEPRARIATLTIAALCDGLLDASILQVYEVRFREPAMRDAKWLAYQDEKVSRGLAFLESDPPTGRRDVAHVGLACVLGYRDLRFEGSWRKDHPRLVAWLDSFAAGVPAFEATRFVG
jgi:glutathione S-transferase